MKINIANNRCFNLTVEDTEFVINTYIKPAYPHHEFIVKKSGSTESIYITVKYENTQTSIRLSSHPNYFSKYNYISPNTKIRKIVGIIVNAIDTMHKKYLDEILSNI